LKSPGERQRAKSEKSKLKKRRPTTPQEAPEQEGGPILGRIFGRKSLSDNNARPTLPAPAPVPDTRPRTKSESRQAPAPTPSNSMTPLRQVRPRTADNEGPTYVRTSQLRPNTADSIDPYVDPTPKKKGFRWGFKRSQSQPDLKAASATSSGNVRPPNTFASPPRLDGPPPLPSLRVSEVFNVQFPDSGLIPPSSLVPGAGPVRSNSDLVSSSARPPQTQAQVRGGPTAPRDVAPINSDREERMKAWAENRAGIGARGLGGGLFFGKSAPPPAVGRKSNDTARPSMDSQRTARQLKPVESVLPNPYSPLAQNWDREGSIRSDRTIKAAESRPAAAAAAKPAAPSEPVAKTDSPSPDSFKPRSQLRRSISLYNTNPAAAPVPPARNPNRIRSVYSSSSTRPFSDASMYDDASGLFFPPDESDHDSEVLISPPTIRDHWNQLPPPSPPPTTALPKQPLAKVKEETQIVQGNKMAVGSSRVRADTGMRSDAPRHQASINNPPLSRSPSRSPNISNARRSPTHPFPIMTDNRRESPPSLLYREGKTNNRFVSPMRSEANETSRYSSSASKESKYRDLALALSMDLQAADLLMESPSPESNYADEGINMPDFLQPEEEEEEQGSARDDDSDSLLSIRLDDRFSTGAGFGGLSIDKLTRASHFAPIFRSQSQDQDQDEMPRETIHKGIKSREPFIMEDEDELAGPIAIVHKKATTQYTQPTLSTKIGHQRKNTEPSFLSFDEELNSPLSTPSPRLQFPTPPTRPLQIQPKSARNNMLLEQSYRHIPVPPPPPPGLRTRLPTRPSRPPHELYNSSNKITSPSLSSSPPRPARSVSVSRWL
jgi:hypothetical protein